ncbi:hypothetical protein ACFQNF_07185 [Iodobacter arcticus]|uniref:Lipoprotein n=1 Tax=Iodobacter arcticus TaxID=590593 RepID=A0ABW2R0L2_9NEIS
MLLRFATLMMAFALTACQESSTPPAKAAAKTEASTPDLFFKKNQAEWNTLQQFIGQNPQDINLWERAPLKHALRLLLGPQLDIFKQNMAKTSPILEDSVLYVRGSALDESEGQAYLLIDIENRKLEVGLISAGKLEVVSTPGESIKFPEDLKPMLDKLSIRM